MDENIDDTIEGNIYFFTKDELNTNQFILSDGGQHLHMIENINDAINVTGTGHPNVLYTKIQLVDGTEVLCEINVDDVQNSTLNIEDTVIDNDEVSQFVIIMDTEDKESDDSCSTITTHVGPKKTGQRIAPKNVIFVDGKKYYQCEYDGCDRKYTSNTSLKVHLRTHLGIQPYKCEICASTFNTTYTLKTHQRTHTGIRPYQ